MLEETVMDLKLLRGCQFHEGGCIVVVIHVMNRLKVLSQLFEVPILDILRVLLGLPLSVDVLRLINLCLKEILFGCGLSDTESVIGIKWLRPFEEVVEAIIHNGHYPLKVVDG